jgi:hypothetical protein
MTGDLLGGLPRSACGHGFAGLRQLPSLASNCKSLAVALDSENRIDYLKDLLKNGPIYLREESPTQGSVSPISEHLHAVAGLSLAPGLSPAFLPRPSGVRAQRARPRPRRVSPRCWSLHRPCANRSRCTGPRLVSEGSGRSPFEPLGPNVSVWRSWCECTLARSLVSDALWEAD